MSDHTPTAEVIREYYVEPGGYALEPQREAEFIRWLAGVKADTLREAASDFEEYWANGAPVSVGPETWLRTRADRIEGEA